MGTWGYRIVKLPPSNNEFGEERKTPHYGICECYYNKDGSVWARSQEPRPIEAWEEDEGDDGPKEIIQTLKMMLQDAERYPVFEDPEVWPKADHVPTKTAQLKTLDTGEIDDIWCGKCDGMMTVTYLWDPDNSPSPPQLSCWDCYHTATQKELAESGMEIVEEEEEDDGQDRDKSTKGT
jgi:hypothetical protein